MRVRRSLMARPILPKPAPQSAVEIEKARCSRAGTVTGHARAIVFAALLNAYLPRVRSGFVETKIPRLHCCTWNGLAIDSRNRRKTHDHSEEPHLFG